MIKIHPNDKSCWKGLLFIWEIKTYHSGDGEPQVIFWGKMARDMVPIIKEYDNWIVYSSKTGKKIYQKRRFGSCCEMDY
mgnify:CR=1 FL=1